MMRTWLRLPRLPRRLVVAAALRLLKLLKLLQLRLQQRKQLLKKLRQNNNVEYISTIALFPVREKALFLYHYFLNNEEAMPDQWRVCNIISVRRTFLYFQMNQKSRRQVCNFILTNMPII